MTFSPLRGAGVALALLALSLRAQPGPGAVAIRNDTLEATYDPQTGRFAVSSRLTGTALLQAGQFAGGGGPETVKEVRDPVLGSGTALIVAHPDGGADQISLYAGLPFALFRTTLHNAGTTPRVIRTVRPWEAESDPATPAGRLTTLGTGGLLAPDRNPGSYQWLALAEAESRRGTVAGWLTSERGSGVLFSTVEHDRVKLAAQIDYGRLRLAAGQSEELETLAVGGFADARDGLEAWAATVARVRHIRLRPQPVVFCTWYAPKPYGAASDEVHLAQLADFAAARLAPFGLSVVQIDDHWQAGVSHDGPKRNFTEANPAGPYPHGMKATADRLSALGFTPGLWFLPFAGTWYDPYFKDHQDWFVKTTEGKPYEVKWGGTCLDMTYAPAREHLREVVDRIVHRWGFRYLKIDGLWTGTATKIEYVNTGYKDDGMGDAVFANPDKTNVEAFRDGLKLVRAAAGDAVFIDGCNTPQNMRVYGAAMGLVDGMRIGPDNKAEWAAMLRGPTFGSRQYFLHGRVWYNDPDPIYVRPEVPLAEARTLCSWAALSGQLNTSSEWYPGLPAERLDLLRRTMPSSGPPARPVDLFESAIPRLWLLSGGPGAARRDVVGVFNWDDAPATIDCPLARLGLDAGRTYEVFDYWNGALLAPVKDRLRPALAGRSCAVLAVRARADHPQLIGTSRQVTQGLADVTAESWDPAGKTLRGRSRVVAGDPYELRIVAETNWAVDSGQAVAEGGAAVPLDCRREGRLIRASLVPAAGGELAWSVRFK